MLLKHKRILHKLHLAVKGLGLNNSHLFEYQLITIYSRLVLIHCNERRFLRKII